MCVAQTVTALRVAEELRGDPRSNVWARALGEGGLSAATVWLVLMGMPLLCVQLRLLPKPSPPPPPLPPPPPPPPRQAAL